MKNNKKVKIFNNLFVDNIYCLYLEEFSDRKIKIQNHLKEINLNVEMFQGTFYKNKGNYGCKKGHLDIIQNAKDNKYENILIIEDDALFLEKFPINMNIPKDFGLFYLGYYDKNNLSIISNESIGNEGLNNKFNLLRMFYTQSTISYIVNINAYNNILDAQNYNTHYYEFIDMFYAHKIQNQFKCYGIYPMVCVPNGSKSSINFNETDEDSEILKKDIILKSQITFNKNKDEKFNNLIKIGNPFHYKGKLFLNEFGKKIQ